MVIVSAIALAGMVVVWRKMQARPPAAAYDAAAIWQDVTRLRIDQARRAFEAQAGSGDRQARLGVAMTLLNTQPLTTGNIDRAASLLQALRKQDADDATGIEATFALARVEQLHRFTPNPAEALRLYSELAARHPEHPLGQMAIVKSAMLRLFAPATREQRLAILDAVGRACPQMTDPDAHRDLHLTLAGAAMLLKLSDEKALEHLLEADRVGLARRKTAGDVYVRLGELARRLGRHDLARQYYTRFADEFPRDQRTHLVRELAAALPATRRSP